jgi:hypothetical protein
LMFTSCGWFFSEISGIETAGKISKAFLLISPVSVCKSRKS